MNVFAQLALFFVVFVGMLTKAAEVGPGDVDIKYIGSCGGPTGYAPFMRCKIGCPQDDACVSLGFNYTTIPCACRCQVCPDGKYYTGLSYSNGAPLTPAQRRNCPDVKAPCSGPGP